MSRRSVAIGVDLGGTKIAAGAFDAVARDGGPRPSGRLLGGLEEAPTEAAGPAEGTVKNLLGVIERALARAVSEGAEPAGIGVGSTGPLDPAAGKLLEADNLPRLTHFPLCAAIRERFGLPVVLTNDGNAFALAEAVFGSGEGRGIVVGVTLGTGCGCGIVVRGKILEGRTANAGEVYRVRVAGGSFDEVLSGRGLERTYRQVAGRDIPGAEVSRLADSGDPEALRAFELFGHDVGEGLGIMAAVLDPSIIVLGGSVAASFRHFERTLREALPHRVAPGTARGLEVEPSRLGKLAGALGAAALVSAPDTIR
ncbi:MAG TPA: ROK family protein [Planctomycetota bacterium]|nr:ROK family protein [Planctomycetota bacterium]